MTYLYIIGFIVLAIATYLIFRPSKVKRLTSLGEYYSAKALAIHNSGGYKGLVLDNLDYAERYYNDAIELDKAYCEAYAAKGRNYALKGFTRDDNSSFWGLAEDSCNQAINICATNEFVHECLGDVYMFRGMKEHSSYYLDLAAKSFEKSLDINPRKRKKQRLDKLMSTMKFSAMESREVR